MVSPNFALQARSGRNVGVSPLGALSAYQQSTSAPYITLADTDTVLWEGQVGCARSPGADSPQFPGLLVSNDTASGDDVDVDIVFVDDQNNEWVIGQGTVTLADGFGPIILLGNGPKGWGAPFCLEVGEKIIARVANTAELPLGRVQVIAYSKDFKVKGQGKGGLSDGGVVCVHGEIESSGGYFEFGPPAGQTWEGLYADASLSRSGAINEPHVGSGRGFGLFIAVQDAANNLTFFIDLVDPAGNVLDVSAGEGPYVAVADQVTLQNVADFLALPGELFLIMPPLQYPAKMHIRHDGTTTFPSGRILVRTMMAASDVASDLSQES